MSTLWLDKSFSLITQLCRCDTCTYSQICEQWSAEGKPKIGLSPKTDLYLGCDLFLKIFAGLLNIGFDSQVDLYVEMDFSSGLTVFLAQLCVAI